MTLDAISEAALIEVSRAQRETAKPEPYWKQPEPSKALATMLSLIAASEAEQRAAKIETTTEDHR